MQNGTGVDKLISFYLRLKPLFGSKFWNITKLNELLKLLIYKI